MTRDQHVKYWINSSNTDARVMESLFSNGHYVWSLFVGHLVVEKLLKALHAKSRDTPAPRTHNLLRLAERIQLELTDDQRAFLDEVTTFNIRARYPDFKDRFRQTATRAFTDGYIRQIEEFRQWLLQKIEE